MILSNRGYPLHVESETDSDGDGGVNPKLSGLGHIEFSQKGIPHGSLHFPEKLQWAGHIFMHDTCAPEAAHKVNIKKAMDRVRKQDDTKTSGSMIGWWLRVRTWRKIISAVQCGDTMPCRKRKKRTLPETLEVTCKHLLPNTCSSLSEGGHNLVSPGARISYNEVPYIVAHICVSHVGTHIWMRIYGCAYMTTHM